MNFSKIIHTGSLLHVRLITLLIGLFLVFVATDGNSQQKWSMAIKPGVHITTENMDEADLGTGYGLEGTVSYSFNNFLSAYAGWGWNQFSADQSFAGDNVDIEETGYTLGLQFNYPTTTSKVTYMVGIGGLYNHVEIEDTAGSIIADSGHGLGTLVETGIIVMIGNHLKLLPYGRYRTLQSEFVLDQTITDFDLKYLSFGVGLSWTF